MALQDVSDVELKDLQNERCPRMSANDLLDLVNNRPDEVAVLDLRNSLEFKRVYLKNSINVPFTSVALGDVRLEALNVPDLEARLANRVVVVVSTLHDNAVLVSPADASASNSALTEFVSAFSSRNSCSTATSRASARCTRDSTFSTPSPPTCSLLHTNPDSSRPSTVNNKNKVHLKLYYGIYYKVIEILNESNGCCSIGNWTPTVLLCLCRL